MHYVIKRISRPIICGKFWHEKPSWGLIIDNTQAKRRGEHVVQSPTDGAQGDSFVEYPPTYRNAWCKGLPRVMGATAALGYISRVAAIGGLSLPCACGPNHARIASNNWGLLSRCLFVETRVEFELSSSRAWYGGKGHSLAHSSRMSGAIFAIPGYMASWLCPEFVP